jgi:hypothetical protein
VVLIGVTYGYFGIPKKDGAWRFKRRADRSFRAFALHDGLTTHASKLPGARFFGRAVRVFDPGF